MKVWLKDSKNVTWLIAGIVAVLVIVIIVLVVRSPKKEASEVVIETPSQDALVTPNKAPVYYTPAPTQVALAPKPSYDEAVRAYGDHRVQFGENCLATPARASFKSGSNIMLDNRSNETKVFVVGGVSYTVAARDFVGIQLPVVGESQDIMIDCGSMENVATLVVQR